MNWKIILIVFCVIITFTACKSDIDTFKDNYSLEINNPKSTYNSSDTVNLSLIDEAEIGVDSVIWRINAGRIDGENEITLSRKLTNLPLGKLTFEAQVFRKGKVVTKKNHITRYAPTPAKGYSYEIINEYDHARASYTQGLEFYGDSLYESTGQFKESDLRITDVKTGETIKKITLPDHIFAEGMTILNDKVYQLTWRAGYGYVYDLSLNKIDDFKYNRSKEGWGLCNDGEYLYKSDGTDKIWKIDPNTYEELGYIQVVDDKKAFSKVNELEYINGQIYANAYQKNAIMIINPKSGALEGVMDLSKIAKKVSNYSKEDNVLNGIAYDKRTGHLFITGKRWEKMFEIKIK